jgi:hypothetical protein
MIQTDPRIPPTQLLNHSIPQSVTLEPLAACMGAKMKRKIGYPVFELFFGEVLLVAVLLAIFKTVISLIK